MNPAGSAPGNPDPGGVLAAGGVPFLSSEILPPDGSALRAFLDGGASLAAAGARVIFVPDAPGGRVGVDPVMAAVLLQRETGVTCVPHLNCRDRNRTALRSALISAAAAGLRGVKAVTGDPAPGGREPARPVYEISSVELVALAADPGVPRTVCVGHSVAQPEPGPADERLHRKIDAGAHVVITTPALASGPVLAALERVGPLRVPIIASLVFIPSAEIAEFLAAERPEIPMPPGFAAGLRAAPSAAAIRDFAIEVALSFARDLAGRVLGFHVAAPFGRPEGAVPLLKALAEGLPPALPPG